MVLIQAGNLDDTPSTSIFLTNSSLLLPRWNDPSVAILATNTSVNTIPTIAIDFCFICMLDLTNDRSLFLYRSSNINTNSKNNSTAMATHACLAAAFIKNQNPITITMA